jgi:hypothetical protein
MTPNNCQIRKVEREARLTADGQPIAGTPVYSDFWGRIDVGSRTYRGGDGESRTVDAALILDMRYKIEAGDIITTESPFDDRFRVEDVRESQDVLGNVLERRYMLVRQAAEA